jgi:hypothetical protein
VGLFSLCCPMCCCRREDRLNPRASGSTDCVWDWETEESVKRPNRKVIEPLIIKNDQLRQCMGNLCTGTLIPHIYFSRTDLGSNSHSPMFLFLLSTIRVCLLTQRGQSCTRNDSHLWMEDWRQTKWNVAVSEVGKIRWNPLANFTIVCKNVGLS